MKTADCSRSVATSFRPNKPNPIRQPGNKKKGVKPDPGIGKKPGAPGASKSKPAQLLFVIIIFVFTFILYGNTLRHSYALDDDFVTRSNTFVQKGMAGIPDIFSWGFFYGFNKRNDQAYRPVSLMSFAVEVGIWGNDPKIHHFFNIFFFALTGLVLFLLLKRLFKSIPYTIPLAITLLFIAHPVHTEAVANIKSRDEILSLLFLLSTLLFLFRYVDTGKIFRFLLSLLFFFSSLLTKEQSVTYLVVIPLAIWFFRDTRLKKGLLISLPFFIVAGLYLFLRARILDSVTFGEQVTLLNNSLAGAGSIPVRLATAMLILGKYLLLLVFPYTLSWDYSYNQIPLTGFSNPAVIFVLLVTGSMVAYALFTIRKKDIHSFTILYFFITILVVSNLFFLIGATMGERFLMTPSVGFCISVAFLLKKFTHISRDGKPVQNDMFFYIAILVILSLYSYKTITRNQDWKNNLALFESGVIASPNSTRTHASLAYEYFENSNASTDPDLKRSFLEKSRNEFEASLKIYPENTYALYNSGVLENETGHVDEAIALFKRAALVDPKDRKSLHNIGYLYIGAKQYDSAVKYMIRNLQLTPGDATLLGDIGTVFMRKKDYRNALKFSEQSFSIHPDNPHLVENLVTICNMLGDTSKAAYYRKQQAR